MGNAVWWLLLRSRALLCLCSLARLANGRKEGKDFFLNSQNKGILTHFPIDGSKGVFQSRDLVYQTKQKQVFLFAGKMYTRQVHLNPRSFLEDTVEQSTLLTAYLLIDAKQWLKVQTSTLNIVLK